MAGKPVWGSKAHQGPDWAETYPSASKPAKGSSSKERQDALIMCSLSLMRTIAIDESHVKVPQVGILVSGTIIMCSWPFIIDCFSSYEERGVRSLVEIWVLLGISLLLGQLARPLARIAGVNRLLSRYQLEEEADSTQEDGQAATSSKKGFPDTKVEADAVEDDDDVSVQKRKAQAEAVAEQGELQTCLQSLRTELAGSRSLSAAAQQLYRIAQLLFKASSTASQELVDQGGLDLVLEVMQQALLEVQGAAPATSAALPALLQASWVLLQVASGPPLAAGALVSNKVLQLLSKGGQAVLQEAGVPLAAKESILRNIMWIWFLLCSEDQQQQQQQGSTTSAGAAAATVASSSSSSEGPPRRGTAAAAAASQQLLGQCGAMGLIQLQMGMAYGLVPGCLSLALMACFVQPLTQQQQQQELTEQEAQQQLAASGLAAMVAPEPLHGLVLSLHQKTFSDPRVTQVLQGLVQQLGSSGHALPCLQVLVEEHLVGRFLEALPQQLARLFLCQLLSTRGQQMLLEVEAAYEMDVGLALGQVIALSGVHLALPSAPMTLLEEQAENEDGEQQQQQQVAAAAGQGVGQQQQQREEEEEVYTDMLACRLLLQHNRLGELVAGYAEELAAEAAEAAMGPAPAAAEAGPFASVGGGRGPAGPAGGSEEGPEGASGGSEVVRAVDALICYLVERDVQLAAAKQLRGGSFDGSSDAASSLSSSISSLDVALQQPDETGVYTNLVEGLVCPQQLPPRREASGVQMDLAGPVGRPAAADAWGEITPANDDEEEELDGSQSTSGSGAASRVSRGEGPADDGLLGAAAATGLGGCSPIRTAAPGGRYGGHHKGDGSELGTCRCYSGRSNGSSSQGDAAAAAAASCISGSGSIVIKFGCYEHRLMGKQLKQLKQTSKLLRYVLSRSVEEGGLQEPITALNIPQFTPKANWWVVQCLCHWADHREIPVGLKPQKVAQLWIAADVLQVEELGAACEDQLAAGFSKDLELMAVALELCSRHPLSSSRLQALAVQALMKGLGSGVWGRAAVHAVVLQYRRVLEAGLRTELRDRIVALCMLNAGVDA